MTRQPKSGFIFSAGRGTRMRHLTAECPKPMVLLQGRPMIDHAVGLLRDAGIASIFANTHHMANRIEPHLNKLDVHFRREDPDILDTGGGLKAMRDAFGAGPLVTLNPDAAWRGPNPIQTLLQAWQDDMHCLLLVTPIERTTRDAPGDFDVKDGAVSRKGPFIYTGAQIIRPEALDGIDDDVFSLNLVWDRIIATRSVHAVTYGGTWMDIGTPEGLTEAERLLGNVQA